MAIDKFLGNSLISRIMKSEFSDISGLRQALEPDSEYGDGDWIDMAGMIAPLQAVEDVLKSIQEGRLADVNAINACFSDIHSHYYDYEWKWAYKVIEDYYGVDLESISADMLCDLVFRWKSSVISLDNMVYEDARKDFVLSSQPQSAFESNQFVLSIRDHIHAKSALGDQILDVLHSL